MILLCMMLQLMVNLHRSQQLGHVVHWSVDSKMNIQVRSNIYFLSIDWSVFFAISIRCSSSSYRLMLRYFLLSRCISIKTSRIYCLDVRWWHWTCSITGNACFRKNCQRSSFTCWTSSIDSHWTTRKFQAIDRKKKQNKINIRCFLFVFSFFFRVDPMIFEQLYTMFYVLFVSAIQKHYTNYFIVSLKIFNVSKPMVHRFFGLLLIIVTCMFDGKWFVCFIYSSCLRDLGRNNSAYIALLLPKLLPMHSFLDVQEPQFSKTDRRFPSSSFVCSIESSSSICF